MKRSSTHRVVSAAALAVLVLGLVSCGSDDESTDATTAPAAAAATSAPAATSAAPTTVATTDGPAAPGSNSAASSAEVKTADTDLGTILVDSEGRTLYMFAPDKQGPSTCMGSCLQAWPSLTGPGTAGEGVDEALLGTATRSDDGTEQVTYDGWPLYYFAQDTAPGDINGQGVSSVWYVVDPSGAPIGMAPTEESSASGPGY